jgi:hypothetical protein
MNNNVLVSIIVVGVVCCVVSTIAVVAVLIPFMVR